MLDLFLLSPLFCSTANTKVCISCGSWNVNRANNFRSKFHILNQESMFFKKNVKTKVVVNSKSVKHESWNLKDWCSLRLFGHLSCQMTVTYIYIYIICKKKNSCQDRGSRSCPFINNFTGTSPVVSTGNQGWTLTVGCRSSRHHQRKPFCGPFSTLMPSSAEFYSFSLPGRLRAVGLNALTRSITVIIKVMIAVIHNNLLCSLYKWL